jgi:hypothetical protein
VLGCTVPFTGLSALKGKMLGQNHFAKPNQHVLISFIQFSFAQPHTEHKWSCATEVNL